MNGRKTVYTRFGRKLEIGEVLPFIPTERISFLGQEIKLESLRLECFAKKGTSCSVCGLQAQFFALEKNKKDKTTNNYHLNLYGYDDAQKEVLFTHDHTIARSNGGKDSFDNVTTMCGPCNWLKGADENPNRIKTQTEIPFKKLNIKHKESIGKYIKLFLDLDNSCLIIKVPKHTDSGLIQKYKEICNRFIAQNATFVAKENFHGDIYINENYIQVRLNSKSQKYRFFDKYREESLPFT